MHVRNFQDSNADAASNIHLRKYSGSKARSSLAGIDRSISPQFDGGEKISAAGVR